MGGGEIGCMMRPALSPTASRPCCAPGCQRHAAGDRQSSGHAGQRGASSLGRGDRAGISLEFSLDVKACAHRAKCWPELHSVTQLVREGSRRQACASFRRSGHELQSDSSRTDSPVRILDAQPGSPDARCSAIYAAVLLTVVRSAAQLDDAFARRRYFSGGGTPGYAI